MNASVNIRGGKPGGAYPVSVWITRLFMRDVYKVKSLYNLRMKSLFSFIPYRIERGELGDESMVSDVG